MKKIGFYKKALHNFGVFLVLSLLLSMLLIPCYRTFYGTVRQDAIEKYDNNIRREMKMMENEINLQMNIIKNVTAGKDFKILSNPPAYGYSTDSTEWFESREKVRESYSVLKSIVSLQDKSFMLFRIGDTQIDSNGSVDDFRTSYGTLWRLTVNKEKCPLDAASLQLFSKKHTGQFDGSIGYTDVTNGEEYELVYLYTLSAADEEIGNDSIFIACYDADKLAERFGFEDDSSSVLITTDENKGIYSFGEAYDVSAYDSCYESDNLNIKVYYNISDNYLKEKMSPINLFILIVSLFYIILGLAVTVGVAVVERQNIRNIIALTDGISEIEYSDDDNQYKYLETIFKSINEKNIRTTASVKALIFVKLLNFKLSEWEIEEVAEHFVSSVCILLLKNTAVKYNTMEQEVSSYLKEKNIELIHAVRVSSSEDVFFIKMTEKVKESLEDLIVYLNKERHADVRGICAVSDSINKVTEIYDRMKKTIHYLEYGSLKCIKDNDGNYGEGDLKAVISKSRQLYEIIRSGNEFEAKRIVYEQWYKITQDEINSENIEPLFFSQISILSQILSENNLRVAVPKFDAEKDVVSVAFEITACIEEICEKLKGNGKKEDVRISQIIDYINQRYCDSSFYMPELVGKFELSDRAIVQMLKKTTGDNFSNYLSKLRISKAKDLLTTTNMPVSDVASASGFDSSNSLYKAFKKVYGVSPSMYRENRKDKNE